MSDHMLAEQAELRARLSTALQQLAVPPKADVFDILVTPCEVNDRHGTGVLLKTIFGPGVGFLAIRSRDVYEGEHTFGDTNVCLPHTGSDAMSRLFRALDGKVPRRILSVPYYPDDVLTTIAISNRFEVPLCTYLMDDQNVIAGEIPDDQMRTLLAQSDVRLGISRDLCEAYEAKYGFKFWFVPAVVPSRLILDRAMPPGDLESMRGVLLGNLWSQRWLDRLRAITCDAGIRLDWYGNPRRDWLLFDEAELERDGIVFRGYMPERELIDRLRQYPYAIVPTGTSDEAVDRPEFARLSLPSRISYLIATANTPLILLGRRDSAAARFVEQLDVGLVSPYDADRFREAVAYVCRPEIQSGMRNRAAVVARAFSSDGMADWIWKTLATGEPCDSRFEELMPRRRGSAVSMAPTKATLRQADVVITGNEVTDKHGTGALVRRIFGQARNVFSIRSFNHYSGDHSFGDASICLNQADASRPDVFQNVLTALRGSIVKRIFCVPYFREDFLTAIAVRDLSGAPLVAWIMDDQNVVAHGVPDALVREFLMKCSLRLATHPELRDAYERKFGFKCWLLPAVVTDRLIVAGAAVSQDEALPSGTGALLGSIWSEGWFEMLWRTLQGAGVTLDWYGNAEYYWLRDSPEDLRRKHLISHGVLPEERLAERLRAHSYIVVPTGTRDHRDDRHELSELSLPGRILFALATAHTPVIVLGSRRTSAARFVERFEVGRVSDYDGGAFREAVAYITRTDVQCQMRQNAARMARGFSDSGIGEWIWKSLERGKPFDSRFEELMTWSSDDAAPLIGFSAAGGAQRD